MDYNEAYHSLIKSKVFSAWLGIGAAKKEAGRLVKKKPYLAHFFANFDSEFCAGEWLIGYYNPVTDRITTFYVGSGIKKGATDEVFKEGDGVKELMLGSVKLGYEQALKNALSLQEEKYSAQAPLRGMVILQNLDKQLWNFTFITRAFSALNIKVDAANGDIDSHSITNLFGIQRKAQ